MENFNQFSFRKDIVQTLEHIHFHKPTPIQEKVIPLVLHHRDVVGISQTGTGKTHAFLLPIIQRIDVTKGKVQAVVAAPTRELAQQIYENAKAFKKYNSDLRISLLIGGSDKQKAISKLNNQPHLVIGTPGRIKDLSIDEQALRITTADIFVIDEADMTLEYGYFEDLDTVLGKMKDDLEMLVFSATIPEAMKPFLRKYMKNPEMVTIDSHLPSSGNVKHYLIPTKHRDRYEVLKDIMNMIDPYICIIFTNTRVEAAKLASKLREDGYKIGEIHGDLEPRERKQMMRRIHNNEYQYIVATDIAARGIDIDGVSHVINMEFPTERDFYIHRSGRCGRGKYTGECFSMYDTSNQVMVEALEKKHIHFEMKAIKNGKLIDAGERQKRKNRTHQPTELEKEVQKIVRKPKKVKPGYKKKRKREIDQLYRKQKRAIIQADIKRQRKERYKKAQAEKRMAEERGDY
ncbi:DEAD/DEAH box helicase [Intestinibaculum porci]|uniref:DEAD/DEAH box helicase n=1 Tax=Intestinibaculum porci TaxID=2487118 RepID=UPI0024095A15|nr:DEAD/DEAH box helicase [Intestinibaculum porci]MDD6349291.1 DEAD/DEAH box helicase [Intestinibaculum porci]MDD6423679.1 DEAD/DEAH box helicase [Intestinibaculum porci]